MLIWLLTLALAAPKLDLPDASVVMPWRDFQTLYQNSLDPKKPPEVAPRDFTLDSASFAGVVKGEEDERWADFRLTIKGRVHKAEGWALVPLLSTSAALRSARLDGKDAPIFLKDGYYTLVTNKAGAFQVELDFAVGVASANGESALALPLAPSGATVASLTVTSKDELDFNFTGAQGSSVVRTGDSHRVEAAVPSKGNLAISWKRKIAEEKAEQLARIYAETHTLVGVGEGVMQVSSTVNYTVLHRGVTDLKVQVPKDVTVLDVRGTGIRDWQQSPDGTIAATLNFEALGAYRLTVDYERATGNGDVPLLRVLDVAREKSFVGVDARSAVELIAGTPENATVVDVRELPPAILGLTDFPVLLAFKARGGAVKIPVEVKTHPDVDMLVTLVDTAVAETLVTVDGRRMTRVRYAVRNNRNQFLRVTLPAGAEVWSAEVGGRGVKVAQGEGGVLLPLLRSDTSAGTLTAFLVELVYVEKGEELAPRKGELNVKLARANAPTSLLQWTVYAPEELKVKKGSREGSVRPVSWFSASPDLPQLDPEVAQRAQAQMNREANAQAAAGTMGQGVAPVQVNLPLAGQQLYWEKMLVLDEELWVGLDYKHKKVKQ